MSSTYNPTAGPRCGDERAKKRVLNHDGRDAIKPSSVGSLSLGPSFKLARSLAFGAARRYGLSPADAEEFSSVASLSLLRKAEKLRRDFRGEASPKTFLSTVIRNCLRDYLISRSGKWRHSARASQLGALAMELERLRGRDRRSDEEAFQILRCSWYRPISREEIEHLVQQLPVPCRRQWVRWDDYEVTKPLSEPELTEDCRSRAIRFEHLIKEVLKSLPTAELTLIRSHFFEGLPLSRLAQKSGVSQRSLYSLKDRLLRQLRHCLEARGFHWQEARKLLRHRQLELSEILHRQSSDGP